MFNFPNATYPTLIAAFVATASAAEPLEITTLPFAAATAPVVEEVDYVDRHIVFLVDVSDSVKANEREAIQKGLAEAMLDDANEAHLQGFSNYALTVVYFASSAVSSDTFFVTSQDDVRDAVSAQLWDLENNLPIMPPGGVGTGTYMIPALTLTKETFDNEIGLGFRSLSKSVVVLGDERPSDYYNAGPIIDTITVEHRATFHAVPINLNATDPREGNLYEFYSEIIQTPEGALGFDDYGSAYPVRAGVTLPVTENGQIVPVVARALDLTAG